MGMKPSSHLQKQPSLYTSTGYNRRPAIAPPAVWYGANLTGDPAIVYCQKSSPLPLQNWSRSAPRLVATAMALTLTAASATHADTVTLKTGRVIKGRVIDKGDVIHVEQRLGGIDIRRTDILKVEFDLRPAADAATPVLTDVVVLTSGQVVRGKVHFEDDGRRVIVEGRLGIAEFDRRDVRTVLRHRTQQEQAHPDFPRAEQAAEHDLATVVNQHLDRYASSDLREQQQGRLSLLELGIFAVTHLQRAELEGGSRGDAASNVLKAMSLREVISARLEESVPGLLRRLTDPSTNTRIEAIREAVLMTAEDTPPLLTRLLDQETNTEVRAMCVSQLAILRAYEPLLGILRSNNDGQLRMAVAIALGDDGILAGLPVLIEALRLRDPALRELAGRKLEEWTGETLGFRASDSPERREAGVARWWHWWETSGQKIAQRTVKAAQGAASISPEDRATARKQWEAGNTVLDVISRSQAGGSADSRAPAKTAERLFGLEKAVWHFRRALEHDPSLASARLSLALIHLEEFHQMDVARRELELLLTRFVPRDGAVGRKTVLYHLGRVSLMEADLTRADVRFVEALREDPWFIDALLARGELAFRRATMTGNHLDRETRAALLKDTVEHHRAALEGLNRQQNSLLNVIRNAQGADGASSGVTEGRVVLAARRNHASLEHKAAKICALIGRTLAASGNFRDALEAYRQAQHLDPDQPSYARAIDLFAKPVPETLGREWGDRPSQARAAMALGGLMGSGLPVAPSGSPSAEGLEPNQQPGR